MRVSMAIQFISQVFPPSSENDCSNLYWSSAIFVITKRTNIARPFYNLGTATPWVWISILNVLASVVLMALTLHFLLRRAGFRSLWTLSWVVLIIINSGTKILTSFSEMRIMQARFLESLNSHEVFVHAV